MESIKCLNCELNDAIKYSKYSNGLFCCKECARAYSTKEKRTEINKKISKTLTGSDRGGIKHSKICQNKKCGKVFIVVQRLRNQKYCSISCRNECELFREKMSKSQSERCSDINERIRLREIGRKGGFGLKGYTDAGIYYQSTFEKGVFEYLEENGIDFEPHKLILNTSKISDVYLPKIDMWIELDGIDREKKKKWIGKDYEYWLEKIELYKENNLNFCVLKSFNDFLTFIKMAL